MAQTTKTNIEVVTTVEGVRLDITKEEAQFIADVTSKIGGSTQRSRRRHADALAAALRSAGISWTSSPHYDDTRITDASGSIHFEDEVTK